MTDIAPTTLFAGKTRPAKNAAASIGLILLSTDEVGGEAFSAIMPAEKVRVFTTRTAYHDESGNGGAFSLKTSFAQVVDTLPPPGRFDVLAFSCTNATVAMGIDRLLLQLDEARPGIRYTSPGIAAIAALRRLRARKVALLTPYPVGIHELFLPFLAANGFEIAAHGTFGLHTDAEIGELTRESIFRAAKSLVGTQKPDALFVSCTATPVVPHLADLERVLGVPVISSSQAMAWDALRLAGYHKPIWSFGRLLEARR